LTGVDAVSTYCYLLIFWVWLKVRGMCKIPLFTLTQTWTQT
jgi:hypothetical protein